MQRTHSLSLSHTHMYKSTHAESDSFVVVRPETNRSATADNKLDANLQKHLLCSEILLFHEREVKSARQSYVFAVSCAFAS